MLSSLVYTEFTFLCGALFTCLTASAKGPTGRTSKSRTLVDKNSLALYEKMNHKVIGDLLLLFHFVFFLQHTWYSMWTKTVLVAGDV